MEKQKAVCIPMARNSGIMNRKERSENRRSVNKKLGMSGRSRGFSGSIKVNEERVVVGLYFTRNTTQISEERAISEKTR